MIARCVVNFATALERRNLRADGGVNVGDDEGFFLGANNLIRTGNSLQVDGNLILGGQTVGRIDDAIRTWVRAHCRLQIGFRDGCNGCGDGPAKIVTANANGTCGAFTQNADSQCRGVWAGLNTDGDVDGR